MKKIMFTAAVFAGVAISACNSAGTSSEKETADSAITNLAGGKYTCSMHPNIVSDKPGKCPECGMTLVEKTEGKSESDTSHAH